MQQRLERFADLIVNFGANVQSGQILDIGTGLGKEDLTRALTASSLDELRPVLGLGAGQ